MFTSGLDQLNLIKAFQLCRQPNNESIKAGEKILLEMRGQPRYVYALMSFMTDPQQKVENKLMAATEIKKAIDHWEWERQDQIDSALAVLLHIYVSSDDSIAKYLRSVIGYLPVSEQTINRMVELDNGQLRKKLRILKLYRKMLDEEEDDLFIDLSGALADKLLFELEESFHKAELLPTAVQYQMVKILLSYLRNALDVFSDKEVVDRWIRIMLNILHQQGTNNDKYTFKLKGATFDCLNFLFPHEVTQPELVLNYLDNIFLIQQKQPQLTVQCLSYMHTFLSSKWWTHDPAHELRVQPVLRRIAEVVISSVYNRQQMLDKFRTDQTNFIQVYFECLNDDGHLYYCRKILRLLVHKKFELWEFFLTEGMKVEEVSNVFLNFLCESAIYCSEDGVKKHKIPLECLLKVSAKLQQSTLKNLDEALSYTKKNMELPDEAVVTMVSVLRFYCYYRPYIPRDDLAIVIRLCSMLGKKCPQMRRLCYYCIGLLYDIFLFSAAQTKPSLSPINMFEKRKYKMDEQTLGLFKVLVDDISELDSMDLQLRDLAFLGVACSIIAEGIVPLEAKLKKLTLTVLELCLEGGDSDDIRDASIILNEYTENIRFEPEFLPYIKKLLETSVNNEELVCVYLMYFERFAQEPRETLQIYNTLIRSDFFEVADCQSVLFANVLMLIARRLNMPPSEIRKIVDIFIKLLKKCAETNSSSQIELLVVTLVGLINQTKSYFLEINDLYRWLFEYIATKRNYSGAGMALLKMMAYLPPTDDYLLKECVPTIIKVGKRYGIADKIDSVCQIAFTHFDKYFNRHDSRSWKTWGLFIENILKKIKHKSEEDREEFVGLFHKFEEKYKPDVAAILRERYQIEMTAMLMEHATIGVD